MLAETERTALTNSFLFSRSIGVAMVIRDGERRRYWSVQIETSTFQSSLVTLPLRCKYSLKLFDCILKWIFTTSQSLENNSTIFLCMFFHFRLYAFRWDHGIKCCFSVFILVWRRERLILVLRMFPFYYLDQHGIFISRNRK